MKAVPKNAYFDVLDNIVDKYNNTYHNIIKMNSIMLNLILMRNAMLIVML